MQKGVDNLHHRDEPSLQQQNVFQGHTVVQQHIVKTNMMFLFLACQKGEVDSTPDVVSTTSRECPRN